MLKFKCDECSSEEYKTIQETGKGYHVNYEWISVVNILAQCKSCGHKEKITSASI